MDRKSTDQFKGMLQTKLQEVQRSSSQIRHQGRTIESTDSKDEGDRALISQTKDMLFRQSAQNAALAGSIRAALARIEDGIFGTCLNCEQEINVKRLKAIPWVRYCVPCQESIENGG